MSEINDLKFYLAMDGNGEIYLYHGKPRLQDMMNEWTFHPDGDVMSFPENHYLCEGLTFENSPMELTMIGTIKREH